MADGVTVEIQDGISKAFDRLGDAAAPLLLAVAKEAADDFKSEVQSRLRRRWPGGTGRTAGAVSIEAVGGGYRVTSGDMGGRPDNLPVWLNYGTKFMTGEAAWDATRLLLAGTYTRRMEDAMQQAIDGLGEV